jgi:hypothetical protein
MSETSNLKIVAPDANSVLVPLHSHFATLASSVDKAVTDRFQVKNLRFETITQRDSDPNDSYGSDGKPTNAALGKPDLVDGDMCIINQNKRQFIWNFNGSTGSWMPLTKRFTFASISERDAMPGADLYDGDSCYVTDNTVDQTFIWNGSAWVPDYGRAAYFVGKQTSTISAATAGTKYTVTFSTTDKTTGFTESSGIVTVPYTGWYNIAAQVNWSSQAASYKDIIVAAGPSASPVEVLMDRVYNGVTATAYTNVAGVVKLNASEVVRLQGSSNVASATINGSTIACSLTITYLGA